ncbi:MAG: hypothetical protein IPQ16_12535 [Geobacteraceae bacterium]|nr:hypothetical protein [Geobacteraceae bacterium]
MKLMNAIVCILMLVTSSATVLFVKALKPASSAAFVFFVVWLLLPYVAMISVLISLHRKDKAALHCYAATFIVTAGGMLLLADTIFWHPDPQGAIAVLMLPILQGIAFAVLLPIFIWISKMKYT